jgi:DNA repair exonuclease SbcCD ATPase subunit
MVNRSDEEVLRELERLKSEYTELNEKRIETDANLKNQEKQLRELKAKAEATYGTSDLNELRALLDKWRRENEEKVEQYREHVEQIKEKLKELESDREGDGR